MSFWDGRKWVSEPATDPRPNHRIGHNVVVAAFGLAAVVTAGLLAQAVAVPPSHAAAPAAHARARQPGKPSSSVATRRAAVSVNVPAGTTKPLTAGPKPPSKRVPIASSFVTRRGSVLYADGAPFRFSGLNMYNVNGDGDCGFAIPNLGAELDVMGPSVNVIRGWFFQYTATNHITKARDWRKMDQTLATLHSHGVRVIATLADEWGACEASRPRGPLRIGWYQQGYRTAPYDSDVAASYRDWVAQVVAHYKDNPTIMAWQLMNEATAVSDSSNSCPDQDSASAALRSWAADMAALVKGIDHMHLLSIGTSGSSQCGTTGARYGALHATAGVDLCEIHDYTAPNVALADGVRWEIDSCRRLNKAIIAGEIGIRGSDVGCSAPRRAADFRAKLVAERSAGMQGELLWAWRSAGDGGSDPCGWDIGPGDPALDALAAV